MKQKSKIKIGLLYGGPSSEYDVSLKTAAQVKKYLSKDKYTVIPILISRNGQWPKGYTLAELKQKIDVAFIAMHGNYGEDGIVQGLLESVRIPYTGSGVLASSLAMDKYRSGLVAHSIGIKVPYSNLDSSVNLDKLSDVVIVKPNTGGSSVGVQMLSKPQLKKMMYAKSITEHYIVQEYIRGVECTASVLEVEEGTKALPVIEIVPRSKFYDYKAKYSEGGSTHIIPARFSKKISEKIQQAALSMHAALGCKTMSRSDFIITAQNYIYYLETNTIPGMTATSLLPEAAKYTGIGFPDLLDLIIKSALTHDF